MQIDGKPTVLDYLYVGGALSTGEFGTRLYAVFDPRSNGEFRWKGWTTLRKRRVARFSYRIARQDSTFRIQYGTLPSGRIPSSCLTTGRSTWTRRRTWCCA